MLLLVAAVVLATRKQVLARVAPMQSHEIYIPESSADTIQMVWPEPGETEDEEEKRVVMAAHLQPSVNPVEVYLDVQPAQQPTVPLGRTED